MCFGYHLIKFKLQCDTRHSCRTAGAAVTATYSGDNGDAGAGRFGVLLLLSSKVAAAVSLFVSSTNFKQIVWRQCCLCNNSSICRSASWTWPTVCLWAADYWREKVIFFKIWINFINQGGGDCVGGQQEPTSDIAINMETTDQRNEDVSLAHQNFKPHKHSFF